MKTATPRSDIKPVLFVLTSHGSKGDTGQPTGYYLGEVTHPLAELEEAGIHVVFASIQGGEPPVDGLELNDPVNARYWNNPQFREAVVIRSAWGMPIPRSIRRSFSPAAMVRCGTFPRAPTYRV